MKKAVSLLSRFAAVLNAVVLSTEIEKAHPECSTSCCRSWTTVASPTQRPRRGLQEHDHHHDLESRLQLSEPQTCVRRRTLRRRANGDERAARHFRPEFLNRVDDIIVFGPLGKEQLVKIIEMRLEDVRRLLADRKVRSNSPMPRKNYCSPRLRRQLRCASAEACDSEAVQDPLALKILDGTFCTVTTSLSTPTENRQDEI